MIDPVIFTIGGFALRWYGVIVMLGVIVGSLMVERALKRHGENSDTIWDALVWVLPIGILGARLWYVINATLGGDTRYANDPSEILKVWHGGLHIFGGLLLGGAVLLYYLNKNKLDAWLFLDAAGPAVLVGQAIGRIANFINQELYGPPTTLPWGIPISAEHRTLVPYNNLELYPVDTTRFHPTFAYEMLWNFAAAGLLLWLSRRYEKNLKPGALFAGWLVLAGVGRAWIELFRPDQPKIAALGISYTTIIATAMAITGAVLLMVRYKALNLQAAENWEDEYKISTQPKPQAEPEESIEAPKAVRVKKVSKVATRSVAVKKTLASKTTTKASTLKKKPAPRTKKSSE